MKRKAIVAGIGNNWVDCLSLDETERAHDEKCGGGGSCGSSGCGCRVSGRPFKAALPRNLKIRVGDTVEVSAPAARALFASLAVLGLPLLCGILGWIAANSLTPELGDGAKAGIAAVSLLIAAGAIVLIGGHRGGIRLPEITAVAG